MEEGDFSGFLRHINDCDPDAPLLSQTTLGHRLGQISLDCVQPRDMNSLTLALSVEQLIPTEKGLARDYRGMAELMGFSAAEVETRFKRASNSAKALIDALIYRSNKTSNQSYQNRISVNDLLKTIEQIERFDVIDDFLPTLVKFASHKATTVNEVKNIPHCSEDITQQDRLTFDDTPEHVMTYDAFISYAPQDIDEAQDLIRELQNRGKRVATAGDLLPGHFENNALMRLIESRCRTVIIIATRDYFHSDECEFQLKFASEVATHGKKLMIIPVLYEMIPPHLMPGMIQYLSKINLYDSTRGRAMQFDRLIRSLDYNNHSLDSRYIQSNRRTSSFNGRLAVESASTSYHQYSMNGHYDHSYSNGNSTQPSRSTNDPIVELSYSKDSSAIRISSPSGGQSSQYDDSANHRTIYTAARSDSDTSFSSSSKKWLNRIKNTFSPRKKPADSGTDVSFASQSLLISEDSSDLTTDECKPER